MNTAVRLRDDPVSLAFAESRKDTVLSIMARSQLLGLLTIRVAFIAAAALVAILARVGDFADIAIVAVDTAELTTILCNDILDVDVSWAAIVLAVSTAAEKLAVVLDEEIIDIQRALAIELEDLVRGLESATAVDSRRAGGMLEGSSVLANIDPPNIVQRAIIDD